MPGTITRRGAVFRGLAGITVLAAGGLAWRAWSGGVFHTGEGPAYEPWRDWRNDRSSGPLAFVKAGILAASAHNTQPWRFRVSDERIEIFADAERHLGSFDPYRREQILSLGCALENMVLAARAQGIEPEVNLIPGTLTLPAKAKTAPVAIVNLRRGARQESALFNAIGDRHTHRGAYDVSRPVSRELLDEMQALVAGVSAIRLLLLVKGDRKSRLGELTVSATGEIIADHDMAAASAGWFRFNWNQVQSQRDGITLDAVGLPPLINAAAKILPAPSAEQADRQWLDATRDVHIKTVAVLGAIAVRELHDRPISLEAGRMWQRLHLWAASRGLAAQPLNQAAEIVDRESELGRPPRMAEALAQVMGDPVWKPTFIFRLGYADNAARLSPRRPVSAVVSKI
jgi:nitroreductase